MFRIFSIGLLVISILFVNEQVKPGESPIDTAQRLLADVSNPNLMDATFQDVDLLRKRYASFVKNISEECSKDECRFSIIINNKPDDESSGTPKTTFGVFFNVESGKLKYYVIGMDIFRPTFVHNASTWVFSSALRSRRSGSSSGFCVGDHELKTLDHMSYYLSPQSTKEERERGFAFNLKCLTKKGGCKKTADLLPGICPDFESK